MPLRTDYCTPAELKAWLRIGDAGDDLLVADAITAVSRVIDGHCNRPFGNITTAATRYYTWDTTKEEGRQLLLIDDVYTVTDLAVTVDTDGDGDGDVTIVSGTDFDLWPRNAAADEMPWFGIMMRPSSATWLPRYASGIAVTARFGWATVPVPVKQATIILAAERFARRNAPFGVAGSPEIGSEIRLLRAIDPDAYQNLGQYVRSWGAA